MNENGKPQISHATGRMGDLFTAPGQNAVPDNIQNEGDFSM